MERYERHFVSQRIGRAVGAVEFDGAGLGVVEIRATDAPARMSFSFTLAGSTDEQQATPVLAEVLLRTAISQVHKELLKPQQIGADGHRCLSNACIPWIGDLEAAPYGGSTSGYASQAEREGR
ncbi:hypothetical protein CR152_19635 [Massilia violaceinigra]|uniref:Uncharacterized protein n=1 Tax=Massilia violaceinigra TaxID=2045208 RepID=A0A2D2DND8_9BURK|nr:hypothetical protein [Massilia violaceinigra]ATQ76487.1 hypothetical protein CR152_19635 [Massilia violaceinigra]